MCHYAAQLTLPVPAVTVVTLFAPTVDVEPVNPAPIVIVKAAGYRRITTPDPPVAEEVPLVNLPPPPPPVLIAPEVGWPVKPPLPPPPLPPAPL
jgi:hypothetical protein